VRAVLVLAALAALVGCGVGSSASTGSSTELRITYWAEGRDAGDGRSWTLRCHPNGGTLPKAAAACTKLDAMKVPFARISPRAICTEIYGGPQEAVVAGVHKGKRVWIGLSAKNGCQIARAKKLGFLVPGFQTNPNA
jgi:hypothetical protein